MKRIKMILLRKRLMRRLYALDYKNDRKYLYSIVIIKELITEGKTIKNLEYVDNYITMLEYHYTGDIDNFLHNLCRKTEAFNM